MLRRNRINSRKLYGSRKRRLNERVGSMIYIQKVQDLDYPEWMTENEEYDDLVNKIENTAYEIETIKNKALARIDEIAEFIVDIVKSAKINGEKSIYEIEEDIKDAQEQINSFKRSIDY